MVRRGCFNGSSTLAPGLGGSVAGAARQPRTAPATCFLMSVTNGLSRWLPPSTTPPPNSPRPRTPVAITTTTPKATSMPMQLRGTSGQLSRSIGRRNHQAEPEVRVPIARETPEAVDGAGAVHIEAPGPATHHPSGRAWRRYILPPVVGAVRIAMVRYVVAHFRDLTKEAKGPLVDISAQVAHPSGVAPSTSAPTGVVRCSRVLKAFTRSGAYS